MIAEGTYKARAVEGALGYASNESEQVAIDFEILEEESDEKGRHITWYGFFTEKTVEVTLKALRACGWSTDDLSDLTGLDQHEVYIVVAHEEDQEGNLRARVRWVNASAGGLALKQRMDEGSAKAFAERMKGHVMAAKARVPGSPAAAPPAKQPSAAAANGGTRRAAAPNRTQPKPTSTVVDNDEIPF